MFSWMLLVFHYLGYTQVFSRYLNHKYSISYQTYYDTLFNYIKESNGVLNAEYIKVKQLITEYLTTGNFTPTSNFDSGTVIIWKTLHELPDVIDTVRSELADFTNTNFKDFTSVDLVTLQEHFTIDISRKYPYNIEVSSEIYNEIYAKSIYNKSVVELQVNSLISDSDADAFYKAMYTGRKQGISKSVIDII